MHDIYIWQDVFPTAFLWLMQERRAVLRAQFLQTCRLWWKKKEVRSCERPEGACETKRHYSFPFPFLFFLPFVVAWSMWANVLSWTTLCYHASKKKKKNGKEKSCGWRKNMKHHMKIVILNHRIPRICVCVLPHSTKITINAALVVFAPVEVQNLDNKSLCS